MALGNLGVGFSRLGGGGRSVARNPNAPLATAPPTVTGTPLAGETLTKTSNGTWSGAATITFTQQWWRTMPDELIPGATASTYTLTATDVGRLVYCKVTGTNAFGSDSANSNTVGPVEEAAAGSPWTLIAHASASGAASATTSAIDTTGANLLIVALTQFNGAVPATVTDSKGNTWTKLTTFSNDFAGFPHCAYFYSIPTAVGSGHTATAAVTSFYGAFTFAAFSGAHTSPIDTTAGEDYGASNVTTTVTIGDGAGGSGITPSAANALVLTNCGTATDTSVPNAVSGDFTLLTAVTAVSGTNLGHRMAWKTQATPALLAPAWTINIADSSVAHIAAFRPVGAIYTAQGVRFDGTSDWLSKTSALSGVVDGKQGLVSFWVKKKAPDGTMMLLLEQDENTGNGLQFLIQSDDTLRISGRDAAGNRLLISTVATFLLGAGWTHVLAAWDLAAGVAQFYVNDASSLASSPIILDALINYSYPEFYISAREGGGFLCNGEIADFYLNLATTLDISVEANRRKFIDASGNPVDLGSDGSTPTGTAPAIFLSGAVGSWHTNKGSGGGFTLNGALTAAEDNP